MTEDKLNKGTEILKKLNWLKDQKKRWEESENIFRITLNTSSIIPGGVNNFDVDPSFIHLSGLKLLTISAITKEIEKVQEEFDKL